MYTYKDLLSNKEILNLYKWDSLVSLKCHNCNVIYYKKKQDIQTSLSRSKSLINCCSYKCSGNHRRTSKIVKCHSCKIDTRKSNCHLNRKRLFCSPKCFQEFTKNNPNITYVELECKYCNIKFKREPASVHDKNHSFCTPKCFGYYNTINKSWGNNRSKLEVWIEKQLKLNFIGLDIQFNNREEIDLELDIYIPSLKLAFEINGVYHYKNIHGQETLDRILKNDKLKVERCKNKNITLYIIDTSVPFRPKTSKVFLDYIIDKIERRI